VRVLLPYRPPYDWRAITRFLALRAIPGLEAVTDERYTRVVESGGKVGWIEVTNDGDQSALNVAIHLPKGKGAANILARVRHLFDLDMDPAAVASVLARDRVLALMVEARPGLRVPGAWDGFELAVRAVLGQQITVKAATRLAGKLVDALGAPVAEPLGEPGLTHTFPHPERFETDTIAALGMPRSRAATLAGIAAASIRDPGLFDAARDLDSAVAHLRELPGIGEWTAQYIAMRALRKSDAFLAGDVALQRLLAIGGRRPTAQDLLTRAEAWRPWRAYAVLHVWTSGADAG
jgi:AraC family transcriptional regulator, regulatory protein of adaptative response / DNA-3-methyladenine glycosylase II